jgi:hypothetical protein
VLPAAVSFMVMGFVPSAAAKPPKGTTTLRNYYYEWLGKVRFPLQPDPHGAYSYVAPSNQAGLDGVGFLVQGQFPHSAWTSWVTYTGTVQPFSVVNFPYTQPAPLIATEPTFGGQPNTNPFSQCALMTATTRQMEMLFIPNRIQRDDRLHACRRSQRQRASGQHPSVSDARQWQQRQLLDPRRPRVHGVPGLQPRRLDQEHVPDGHRREPRQRSAGRLPAVQPVP